MTMVLDAIHIHPVKSCHRIELSSVAVTETGLARDRMWQVVDDEGNAITQRQKPVLATVQPHLLDGGIRLTAPDRQALELVDAHEGDTTVQSLVGVPVQAADGGDIAAAWFSDLLDQPCRVAGLTPTSNYRLPEAIDMWGTPLSFADAAPVLVANTASLHWLQERAAEPFAMDRFRPNLIVESDDPWAEDTWQEFTIGTAALTVGAPWPRCTIPQIDQDTGGRHKEPARVLKQYRWCDSAPQLPEALRPLVEGNSLFGVACKVGPLGTQLSVGEAVSILSTQPPVLTPPA